MAIQYAYDLLKSTFLDVNIFGITWMITAIATLLTLYIITNKKEDMLVLALPVTLVLHINGLTPSIVQYLITTIAFVSETLSLETAGTILQTTGKQIGRVGKWTLDKIPKTKKLRERETIRKELEKAKRQARMRVARAEERKRILTQEEVRRKKEEMQKSKTVKRMIKDIEKANKEKKENKKQKRRLTEEEKEYLIELKKEE